MHYRRQRGTMEKLLNTDEVAERVGCHRVTVLRKIRSRELPATSFGRRWLIRERDLERYLRKRELR